MPPNNSVIMQNNFIAGRVSGTTQDTQLRFANAAGSSAEFDFVKPGATSFTESGAYRFALDPLDAEDLATFSYSHGAVTKNLFRVQAGDADAGDVYLNADDATVGALNVTGTASIANLNVDKLYATTLTYVNQTITVNIYATDGGIDVANLEVTNDAGMQTLNVTGTANIKGDLNVTGAAVFTNNVLVVGVLTAGSLAFTSAAIAGSADIGGNLSVVGTSTLQSTLYVADLKVTDNAFVGANLEVAGSAAVTGAFSAGASSLSSADIAGNAKAGSLNVTDNAVVTGTLSAGASTLASAVVSGTLTAGASTLASAVVSDTLTAGASTLASATVTNTLSAGASTLASASITNTASIGGILNVTGAATLSSATVTNALSAGASTLASAVVSGTLTAGASTLASASITNNASIGAALQVTGAATLSDSLNVAAAATALSLKSTNNADVGGNLHVTGYAVIDQTLEVKQNSTLSSLKVTGAASMNSLQVTGSASLDSFLIVASTSSFGGNMNITGSVYVSGPIVSGDEASATAFSTTSDRRLKKDFAEVADALAKVQALHPVFYNWISSPNVNPAEPELGFIAQEVEEVLPGVVSTADDEMKTKRVCYDRITSLLVAAMKEQSAVIAALQARVASLESRA